MGSKIYTLLNGPITHPAQSLLEKIRALSDTMDSSGDRPSPSQLNAPGVGPEISAGSGPGNVNIDSV